MDREQRGNHPQQKNGDPGSVRNVNRKIRFFGNGAETDVIARALSKMGYVRGVQGEKLPVVLLSPVLDWREAADAARLALSEGAERIINMSSWRPGPVPKICTVHVDEIVDPSRYKYIVPENEWPPVIDESNVIGCLLKSIHDAYMNRTDHLTMWGRSHYSLVTADDMAALVDHVIRHPEIQDTISCPIPTTELARCAKEVIDYEGEFCLKAEVFVPMGRSAATAGWRPTSSVLPLVRRMYENHRRHPYFVPDIVTEVR